MRLSDSVLDIRSILNTPDLLCLLKESMLKLKLPPPANQENARYLRLRSEEAGQLHMICFRLYLQSRIAHGRVYD